MPELVADPPSLSCCHLFSEPGIKTSQRLDPDLFCLARDATGRSASCPSGRPRGSDITPGDSLRDNLNGNVALICCRLHNGKFFIQIMVVRWGRCPIRPSGLPGA
jgi:hypothetical protein